MSHEIPLPRWAFVYVVVISAVTLLTFVLAWPASIGAILWILPGIALMAGAVIRQKFAEKPMHVYIALVLYTLGGVYLLYMSFFFLVVAGAQAPR